MVAEPFLVLRKPPLLSLSLPLFNAPIPRDPCLYQIAKKVHEAVKNDKTVIDTGLGPGVYRAISAVSLCMDPALFPSRESFGGLAGASRSSPSPAPRPAPFSGGSRKSGAQAGPSPINIIDLRSLAAAAAESRRERELSGHLAGTSSPAEVIDLTEEAGGVGLAGQEPSERWDGEDEAELEESEPELDDESESGDEDSRFEWAQFNALQERNREAAREAKVRERAAAAALAAASAGAAERGSGGGELLSSQSPARPVFARYVHAPLEPPPPTGSPGTGAGPGGSGADQHLDLQLGARGSQPKASAAAPGEWRYQP